MKPNIIMTVGFIILRSVRDSATNKYWINSYECIRKFYPDNHILIIDDNSVPEHITDHPTHKTTRIQSEYPGRGELLPYYYYLKNKLFDTAVILHDSAFINKPLNLDISGYRMIWDFEHDWDQVEDETRMLEIFNDKDLSEFHRNKSIWYGCFGGMSIITHEYLMMINNKFDLSLLLPMVLTRYNRCSFERVISVLLNYHSYQKPLLGNIHRYCPWGVPYRDKSYYSHLPIIKVWTGR